MASTGSIPASGTAAAAAQEQPRDAGLVNGDVDTSTKSDIENASMAELKSRLRNSERLNAKLRAERDLLVEELWQIKQAQAARKPKAARAAAASTAAGGAAGTPAGVAGTPLSGPSGVGSASGAATGAAAGRDGSLSATQSPAGSTKRARKSPTPSASSSSRKKAPGTQGDEASASKKRRKPESGAGANVVAGSPSGAGLPMTGAAGGVGGAEQLQMEGMPVPVARSIPFGPAMMTDSLPYMMQRGFSDDQGMMSMIPAMHMAQLGMGMYPPGMPRFPMP